MTELDFSTRELTDEEIERGLSHSEDDLTNAQESVIIYDWMGERGWFAGCLCTFCEGRAASE